MSTDYRQPRRINVVSILLLCIVAGGVYAGWKFVPVFWQGRKVDEALDELKLPAAQFHRMGDDVRRAEADKILARAVARLHEIGIDDTADQPLQVWFAPDYSTLNARYQVIVTHPAILKPTVFNMDREREIPKY